MHERCSNEYVLLGGRPHWHIMFAVALGRHLRLFGPHVRQTVTVTATESKTVKQIRHVHSVTHPRVTISNAYKCADFRKLNGKVRKTMPCRHAEVFYPRLLIPRVL